MSQDSSGKLSLYSYQPSKVPAAIFAIAFFGPTLFHLAQICKFRAWFLIALLLGAVFEVLGYSVRIASIRDDASISLFATSLLLILVAPILFAASIYMSLGRLIRELNAEAWSPVRPTWMTKIFVAGDIISFLAQAGGASMLTKQTKSAIDNGQRIIVVGLLIQLAFFGLFIWCIIVFHKRVKRNPVVPESSRYFTLEQPASDATKLFPALYVASALVLVRSIFRLIEYLWHDGPLGKSEVYLYVFDAFPMLAMLVYWNILPAGRYLPNASVKAEKIPNARSEAVGRN